VERETGQSVAVPRRIDWVVATCVDGPLAGKELYAANHVGCRITVALPPVSEGDHYVYEVVRRQSADEEALARFVVETP
jgi:hypothetical protein